MAPFPTDAAAMARAVALAERGRGAVEPNPCVGAVLTTPDRRPVAEGWHARFGGPHAEVNALRAAGDRARGATLFVTLEPCSHHGKTPPCADAVIAAGVRRVVVGTRDPAPHVDGGGLAKLGAAGVEVEVGVLQQECRAVAAPFFKRLRDPRHPPRPWVVAKWAMSLDGRTSARPGGPTAVSGPAAKRRTHRWRGECGAVVVGAGTARADDPHLGARPHLLDAPAARTPLRVVVGSQGALAAGSQLALTPGDGPVLVTALPGTLTFPLPGHAERLTLPPDRADPARVDPAALLDALADRGVYRVLLEGGGRTAGHWFDRGLVDEVRAFVAPALFGARDAPTPMVGAGGHVRLHAVRTEPVGPDVLILGHVRDPDGWFPSR